MATGRVPTTANSPLTAKGDLFGYSTTQARVAVGNNGETIVADSSTSTGLSYQADFAAGKNKIINGKFDVWQRGTTFTAAGGYTADRWTANASYPTTVTQQTFTPGAAPVAGYESQYFMRLASQAGNIALIQYKVEDVRTLAGQTVTLSYWAKIDSAASINVYFDQNFGSGGSTQVSNINSLTTATTTSWVRYTTSFTMPSISGKTVGTSSYLQLTLYAGIGRTLDLWGVQLEAGSVATAFQTATGTLQGELAACRRYLPAVNLSSGPGVNLGYAYATNSALFVIPFDVVARTQPTGISIPTVSGNFTVRNSTNGDASATTMIFDVASVNNACVLTNGTLTAGSIARLISNTGAGYILFTGCEL